MVGYMAEYQKVLIVDDELIARQGIKHMIAWEKEGFQIVGEASNGQEALDLMAQVQPDIILSDMVMPVLNGIDFSYILKEKYPQVKMIILSSYEDFEYVKTTLLNGAVDYVLKPTLSPEILLAALEKAVGCIPGARLNKQTGISTHRQMADYLSGQQDTLEWALFEKRFPYMQFCVLGIDLKSACKNNREQISRLIEWFKTMFSSDQFYTRICAFINDEVLCYIFNFRNKDEGKMIEEIQNCAVKAALMAENILFVLSNSFSKFHDIRQHFEEEVMPGVKQKFYFPEINFVTCQDVVKPQEIQRFHYEKFTEYLSHKNYQEALRLLRKYTSYLCEQRYDEYLTKNMIKNLLYNFVMSVENSNISSEKLKRDFFQRIDMANSVDEFLQCCDSIFEMFGQMADKESDNEDWRIKEIKEYIQEHSGEKLDLAEIAHVFNFNYNYISSYFSQHISEGFSGYLNKVRIEKACGLLKACKIPIADVGGQVGYSDHGYFCRVFKKITGMTPSQYRHSMRE